MSLIEVTHLVLPASVHPVMLIKEMAKALSPELQFERTVKEERSGNEL